MKYILVLIGLLSGVSLFAQPSVQGYVITEQGDPIPSAHVTNTRNGKGTLSQSDGFFRIAASEFDTLRISRVGYQSQNLLLTAESFQGALNMVLNEDSVLLPGITVYDRIPDPVVTAPERTPMKVNSVRSKEEIVPKKTITFNVGNPVMVMGGVPTIGVGGSITGVLTHVYDRISKEGKERRKYEESREKTAEEAKYTELLNSVETAETLQAHYQLSPAEYERLIAAFNEEFPDAKKMGSTDELWGLLHYYFNQHAH